MSEAFCVILLWRVPFCTVFAANGNRSKFELVLDILKPTATSAPAVYDFRDARNHLTICNTCTKFLQSCVVPKHSIDNAFDFGLTPLELQVLIDIEPQCILRYLISMSVSCLHHVGGQLASRGHTTCSMDYAKDISDIARCLPRPVDECAISDVTLDGKHRLPPFQSCEDVVDVHLKLPIRHLIGGVPATCPYGLQKGPPERRGLRISRLV
jgi:hypothetical protein